MATKFLGPGASAAAMFLSLTSFFNAHCLPRLLANSPETLLTNLAILYFPLPRVERPGRMVVGEENLVVSPSMRNVRSALEKETQKGSVGKRGDTPGRDGRTDNVIRVPDLHDLDYALMDRAQTESEGGV